MGDPENEHNRRSKTSLTKSWNEGDRRRRFGYSLERAQTTSEIVHRTRNGGQSYARILPQHQNLTPVTAALHPEMEGCYAVAGVEFAVWRGATGILLVEFFPVCSEYF